MKKQRSYTRVFLFVLCALITHSCSGPDIKPVLTRQEVLEKDFNLGNQIALRFEKEVTILKQTEIEFEIEKISKKLITVLGDLEKSSIKVKIISEKTFPFSFYSVPGVRIYLSQNFLKEIQTENEMAAALAFHLSHIYLRSLPERVEFKSQLANLGTEPTDDQVMQNLGHFFDQNSIFSFSVEKNIKAIRLAIKVLYKSEYDARGLVEVWEHYLKQKQKQRFTEVELIQLISETKRELKKYSPLRNPIVQSESFTKILEKVKNL